MHLAEDGGLLRARTVVSGSVTGGFLSYVRRMDMFCGALLWLSGRGGDKFSGASVRPEAVLSRHGFGGPQIRPHHCGLLMSDTVGRRTSYVFSGKRGRGRMGGRSVYPQATA